ncbi:hypothetical protein GCM10007304_46620 [Rhodococcoides trifolii]|uniref:SWIM-type domain-containing protein n=1 Tax=Rhodococcoides trifolii TaxID=908250 RepID=A0A917G7Z2_9NOCA|nr:hypothetical protein [Rhodococcus trifolii]GGG27449.1 hypothetical protein GCM10007304_46620 [Rhodococcus trifolii]
MSAADSQNTDGTRRDLAALTDDALSAVANRGLVKRAIRMQENEPPELSISNEAIVARFADGVETVLRAGEAFVEASCSCGARSVCRHRVGLVLACRDRQGRSVSDAEQWSPAEFDDDALTEHLGKAALSRAQRTRSRGYAATIHRPVGTDRAVRVELPHCSVRFLVPHDLSHAHSSATDETSRESVALAVWAAQEADASHSDRVFVGRRAAVLGRNTTGDARALARTILLNGVTATTSVQLSNAIRTTKAVESGTAVWLADACAELTDQMDAYLARHARHSRVLLARAIAEIHARVQLGDSADLAVAADALGTDAPGETPLRRAHLISMGARVRGDADSITASLYFADTNSDAVFVVEHGWATEVGEHPTGYSVSDRRIAGSTVAALASSTVVTESVIRRANHRIRFVRRGIGRSSVMPSSIDAWLKSTAVVENYRDASRRLSTRHPWFARERLVTDSMGCIRVEAVSRIDYQPDEQRLAVTVRDQQDGRALVALEHSSSAPGALDAVTRAMSSHPVMVAGHLSNRSGQLLVTPTAIACADGIVVPDLASGDGSGLLSRADIAARQDDPIGSVIDAATALLADLSHLGLQSLSSEHLKGLRLCADRLDGVGMATTARAVRLLAECANCDDREQLADAWNAVMLRLTTAADNV